MVCLDPPERGGGGQVVEVVAGGGGGELVEAPAAIIFPCDPGDLTAKTLSTL